MHVGYFNELSLEKRQGHFEKMISKSKLIESLFTHRQEAVRNVFMYSKRA